MFSSKFRFQETVISLVDQCLLDQILDRIFHYEFNDVQYNMFWFVFIWKRLFQLWKEHFFFISSILVVDTMATKNKVLPWKYSSLQGCWTWHPYTFFEVLKVSDS